jgi:pantetheine-phosphate adenylyltransferase
LIKALYPGSFDPITNGHIDIVKRASHLFEKVIIGVYDRPNKKLMFSVDERVAMAKGAVELLKLKNVEVASYKGLTVAFAKSKGVNLLVRGLRAISDFEGEFEMAMMNKKLEPDIEFACFMAGLHYQFYSSSLIKEVARLGGCVDSMVPENVVDALNKKLAETAGQSG